tara:strand:- start:128 stop:496 length:369 start_codon:yes stop_codon:yes gene_type:complete
MSSTQLGSLDGLLALLSNLDDFTIVKASRDAKEIHFSNGLKAIYRVETRKTSYSTMTFQAVLQVRLIDDQSLNIIPIFWGATSEAENREIVRWFQKKELEFDNKNRKRLEKEYIKLTKHLKS